MLKTPRDRGNGWPDAADMLDYLHPSPSVPPAPAALGGKAIRRPGARNLWVEGVSVASITTSVRPGGSLAGPGVAVTIGNCPNENRPTFDGLIDEVRISNGLALPAAPQPVRSEMTFSTGSSRGVGEGMRMHRPQPVQMPVNRSVESPKRSSSKPPHSIRLRNRLHIRRLEASR